MRPMRCVRRMAGVGFVIGHHLPQFIAFEHEVEEISVGLHRYAAILARCTDNGLSR